MARRDAVFLLNNLGLGGSERKVIHLAGSLRRAGLRVGFAYLQKPDDLASQLPPDVPLTFLDRRGRLSLRALRALLAELRSCGPSVLVAVNIYPAIYATLAQRLARGSVVRTVCLQNTNTYQRWRDRWFRPLYLWSLRSMDVVVYGSEAQRALWVSPGTPAWGRSRVIYNGVRLEYFSQPADEVSSLQARVSLGIPAQRFVFGSTGRLVDIKNYGTLVDALARLRARQVDAQLLLVGDGPMRAALQQQAAQLNVGDYVTLTGSVDDVRPALTAMDVFVLPSTDETFSNAVLEAMAMARPVVLSDIGGACEMVTHEQEGYLLASQSLSVDLVTRLESLKRDASLRLAMGRAARARVVQQFSAQAMFEQYRRLLQP